MTINDPVNFLDPSGLAYVDFNVTGGMLGFVGTAGVMIGLDGNIMPYIGGGLSTNLRPNISGSSKWSPFNPSPGLNGGLQTSLGFSTTQFGVDAFGMPFVEKGGSFPNSASITITGYYVFALNDNNLENMPCQ